ncbi:MAG: zf-TFIIB domain-containing protein, partial [Chloroflexi bacterium]|nr:zf-TFIIB domain-containing protein [Chloroflexota bacterium]
FDAGELDLLLERLALDGSAYTMGELMGLPAHKVAEKARPCPICRQKMRKVLIGHEPKVLVDICVRGHGVWFDRGELDQVIIQLDGSGSAASAKHERVVAFLGNVFKAK